MPNSSKKKLKNTKAGFYPALLSPLPPHAIVEKLAYDDDLLFYSLSPVFLGFSKNFNFFGAFLSFLGYSFMSTENTSNRYVFVLILDFIDFLDY